MRDERDTPLNDNGFELREVSISDLLLDLQNPRIRLLGPRNQREAVERIFMTKSEQLYRLARDMCRNGMTIMPIVTCQGSEGEALVVKDGNRRVAALKLLRDPDLLPKNQYRQRFERLSKKCSGRIPAQITVYHGVDADRIDFYIDRLHMGSSQGEGQVEWSAVEKALFELENPDRRGQNDMAAHVLKQALSLGIPFSEEFPITTLTRLLNTERLHRLGFGFVDGTLKAFDEPAALKSRLQKLIYDLDKGRVHVRRDGSEGSIYTRHEQDAYLERLLADHPPVHPTRESPAASANGQDGDNPRLTGGNQQIEDVPSVAVGRTSAHAPRKSPYDRKHVIQRKEHKIKLLTGADCPEKARALLVELKELRSDMAPISATFAIRALLEIAVDHCIDVLGINMKSRSALKDKITETMKMLGDQLEKDTRDSMSRLITSDHYLSLTSMNKIVHNRHFPTDGKTVHQLWDQVREFIEVSLNQRRA